MILVTSNSSKRREFERFQISGLQIEEGADIREVQGTPDEIAIHKAIDAGEGRIVEDAIIVVDGEPIIDVKWHIKAIVAGKYPVGTPIEWQVRLSVLKGDAVNVYYGVTKGTVCKAVEDGFGIDPIIMVTDAGQTLAALDREGTKDGFSARRQAVQNLIEDNPSLSIPRTMVSPWDGAYQNE